MGVAFRQAFAAAILAGHDVRADRHGLHLWHKLPPDWPADTFRAEAATRGVQIVEGAAFAAEPGMRPNAVRPCLGHEPDENYLAQGLETLSTILSENPSASSLVL